MTELELLVRKLALKDAELAMYTQESFTAWVEKQYEEIETKLAMLGDK